MWQLVALDLSVMGRSIPPCTSSNLTHNGILTGTTQRFFGCDAFVTSKTHGHAGNCDGSEEVPIGVASVFFFLLHPFFLFVLNGRERNRER